MNKVQSRQDKRRHKLWLKRRLYSSKEWVRPKVSIFNKIKKKLFQPALVKPTSYMTLLSTSNRSKNKKLTPRKNYKIVKKIEPTRRKI